MRKRTKKLKPNYSALCSQINSLSVILKAIGFKLDKQKFLRKLLLLRGNKQ